jgi:hypothetical protein
MPNERVFLPTLEASLAINLETVARYQTRSLGSSALRGSLLSALNSKAARERIISERLSKNAAHEVFIALTAPQPKLHEKTAALLVRGVPVLTLSRDAQGRSQLDAEGQSGFDRIARTLSLSAGTSKAIEQDLTEIALTVSRSAPGLMQVTTVFTHQNREVARLALDLVIRESNSAPLKLSARFANQDDWLRAIKAVPVGRASIKETLPLPLSTFSKFRPAGVADSKAQWVLTPEAEWTDRLLNHLKAALIQGYPVRCTVLNPRTTKSISFPVSAVEGRGGMRRHGVYLKPGQVPKIADLSGRTARPISPVLAQSRINAGLLWARKATHVAAPLTNEASKRQAFSVKLQDEKRLHAEIVKGSGASNLPVIELKTRVYRFYLDIDFHNVLIGSLTPLLELKKAQREYFAGDALSYSRLGSLLGRLFPTTGPAAEAMVSTRHPHASHEGHHVVFPDVLLQNDGVSGHIVARHLEAVAARAQLQHTQSTVVRFLCQALVDDALNLAGRGSPITIHIPAFTSALAGSVNDAGAMVALVRDAVVFGNRGFDSSLDRKDIGSLVDFAAKSMGDEALQRFFDRLQSATSSLARSRVLYRLCKRMRWEILRRARYFDHSIYDTEMGLRMLGTLKPNDSASSYRPVGQQDRLTVAMLAAHSIRAPKAKPSSPSRDFGEILTLAGVHQGTQRPQPISLAGMLMPGRLVEEIDLADLEVTFEIKQKARPPANAKLTYILGKAQNLRTYSIELSKIRLRNNVSSQFTSKRFPDHVIMAPDANTIVHGFPPRQKRSSPARIMASSAPSAANTDQIVIRVYIPSPIVQGPYGQDFAGDSRGESYGSGTSRLEVEVLVDRTTGAMSHQSYWGRTNGYDPDDTRPVPLKPSWWRDKAPGAAPNGSAILPANPDNVSIARTIGNDGSTKVEVKYSGKNPLLSLAPAIDGSFSVAFNADGTVTVDAQHDGFPAHTAYLNGQLIHAYDPELAGAGPTALFGRSDIKKRYSLRGVPPRPQPGQGPGRGGPFDRDDDSDGLGDTGGSDDARDDDDGDTGDGQSGTGGSGAGDTGGAGNSAGGGNSGGVSSPEEQEPDGSQTAVVPVDLQTNADGTVTATAGDGYPETFTYDPALGGWVGDGGSVIMGDQNLFDSDAHIEIVRDIHGNDTFYFCNADGCVAARHISDTYGLK